MSVKPEEPKATVRDPPSLAQRRPVPDPGQGTDLVLRYEVKPHPGAA
jgi:hypothetical protein